MRAKLKARAAALLSDDSAFLAPSACFFGVLAFCKGIRLPNLWAATQAQLDYRHGLVKRGLFGAVFTAPLRLSHYTRFAVFSDCLLLLVVALVVALAWQTRLFARGAQGTSVLVFASSLAVTFLAHIVGYLDIPELIVVLTLLLVRKPSLRFALALPLSVAGLLLHESFLLIFLPVILFSFLVDSLAGRVTVRRAATFMLLLACLALGCCAFLAFHAPMTAAQAATLQTELQARADFPLRPDFFTVLSRSLSQNMHEEFLLYADGQEFGALLSSLVALGPVILFQLWMVRRIVLASAEQQQARWLQAGACVAALAPLGMLLLGWDVGRWFAIAALDAFLTVLIISRAMPHVCLRMTPRLARGALLLTAINMASGETLLDYEVPKPYPFVSPAQHFVRDMLHGDAHLQPGR